MLKFALFFTIFVMLWFGIIRPWLRKKPWAQWFFLLPPVEWFEINVYRKSETIGWGRYLAALGTVMTGIAQVDPATAQTLVQMFEPVLPEAYKNAAKFIPMVITLAGLFTEMQRRDTTKPLDLVSVPSDAPVEVKQAVAQVEATNAEAVAEVKAAEEEKV